LIFWLIAIQIENQHAMNPTLLHTKVKTTFTSLLLFISFVLHATNISGVLTENTTLTLAESPYVLTGDLTVDTNIVLTIEPGVVLNLSGRSVDLVVRGTLVAEGTAVQPITFYSTSGDGGGSVALVANSLNSSLRYCEFSNLSRSFFYNTYDCALFIDHADVDIAHCTFFSNVTDVRAHAGSVDGFEDNNDLFQIRIINNSFDGSSIWPNADAGGFEYYLEGDLIIDSLEQLIIDPGVVVNLPGRSIDINVYGKVSAIGNAQDSIKFYSSATDGGGSLAFLPGSENSILQYSIIENLGKTFFYNTYDCALFINQADIAVDHCTFKRNIVDVRASASHVYGFDSNNDLAQIRIFSNSLTESSNWPNADDDGFEYYLEGDLRVDSLLTLTIDPAVTVNLPGRSIDLQVFGTLIANGNTQDSIHFYSSAGDGGGSIAFLQGSIGSSLTYSSVRRLGLTFFYNAYDCAVYINGGEVAIDHTVFESNVIDVRSDAASVGDFGPLNDLFQIRIFNNSLDTNAVWPVADENGFEYFLEGDLTIPEDDTLTINPGVTVNLPGRARDIQVYGGLEAIGLPTDSIQFYSTAGDGGGSIAFLDGSQSIMRHASIKRLGLTFFYNTYDCAVYINKAEVDMDFCLFDNNVIDVRSDATSVEDFGPNNDLFQIRIFNNSLDTNSVWPNADSDGFEYFLEGDLTVDSMHTLTIEPGATVNLPGRSRDLIVIGTLDATGTIQDSIRFYSSAGDGGGSIAFLDGSDASVLSYCEVSRLGLQFFYNTYDCAVYVQSDMEMNNSRFFSNVRAIRLIDTISPVIRENKIQNNTVGIFAEIFDVPDISFNSIENNTSFGIQNLSSDTLTACNNYWGDPSGPTNAANNPGGLGDRITNNVIASDCFIDEPSYVSIDPTVVGTSCIGDTDGSITLEVTGGEGPYIYEWSIADTDSVLTNLAPDTYMVTVTDVNGLLAFDTYTIAEPLPVSISTETFNTVCFGDSITITAVNGNTYNWSNGETTNIIKVSPAVTTTYTLSGEYGTNCAYTEEITIIVVPFDPPGQVSNMLPSNFVDNLQLPFTLSWDPSNNTSNYDIFIWPDTINQPAVPFVSSLANPNFTVTSGVNYGINYNWRVISKNDCFTTEGPVQQFSLRLLPDFAVSNVSSGETMIQPGDVINLSWDITNIGVGFGLVDWSEKIYIQSIDGSNRTLVSQETILENDTLLTNEVYNRTAEITVPDLLSIENTGVFVVELIPGDIESANAGANNTGVESPGWTTDKFLSLSLSEMEITEGGSDVTATVIRSGSILQDLVVDISVSDATRITSPTQLTIPAGQSGVSFMLSAIDNSNVEGDFMIDITAASAGYTSATETITLIDDEAKELSLVNLPTTINEGSLLSFEIQTNFISTDTTYINILSSDPDDIPVVTPVKIIPGANSATVTIQMPDDDIAEADEDVMITIGSAGYISDEGIITIINDNDIPAITFEITIDTISETAGIFATEGIITRLGDASSVLTINIDAEDPAALFLPSSVPLGPGVMEKRFDIGVIDNNTVDGFRTLDITAAVLIDACNCTASAMSAGVFTDQLTIADNDGPSLSLLFNPLSIAEGLANGGTLTVTRNTPTTQSLDVTLINSDATELSIPSTVTIPAGSASVDVSLTGLQDNIPDGNQQVTIQANADGFSPGIAWAIVTDINKPDLQVADLSLPDDSVPAAQNFQFTLSLSNPGLANAPLGTNIKLYLSEDLTISPDDIVVSDFFIPVPVIKDDLLEITDVALAPEEAGNYFLIAIVNAEQQITEIQYFNNTSEPVAILIEPDYGGTAVVDELIFLQGEEVPIYGTSVDDNGNIVPNVELEVYVTDGTYRREILVTTDENGVYSTIFQPLPNEGGHYIVGASFPEINSNIVQDEFDILGVSLNSNQDIQWEFLLGDTLQGSIVVENLSDFPLTNISIVPSTLPAGASINFETIPALAGNEIVAVNYEVSGTEVSPGLQFQTVELSITSDENIQQDLDAYYLCQAQAGMISASISSIDRTVSVESSNKLEFQIFNEGLGESGEIFVDFPGVDFMSLISLETIPSIGSGDTSTVIIEFLPSSSLPLNTPASGTIVISAENANFIVIPYVIQKVSDETGSVVIDVVDQYTYFTEEAPHLAGASVKITNYFTGEVFAEGTTNADGLFTALDLPEGLLRVVVQADQHDGYDGTITVLPGKEIVETVFLSYQAISFSWDVVPTTIEDEYQVDLIMEFETNVPLPVVTIDAPKELPELFGNDTYSFNVTMVNEGLITARDVELNLPSDPEYEFITNYVPTDLLAQQAIQVPVVMKRRDAGQFTEDGKFEDTDDVSDYLGTTNRIKNMGLNCVDVFTVAYWYECGPNGVWQYAGQSTVFLGRLCSGPGSNWNPTGSPCTNCPPSGTINPTPVATGPTNCLGLDCLKDIALAAASCATNGLAGAAVCALSVGTSDPNASAASQAVTGLGCWPGPIGCGFSILGAANTCFGLFFADEKEERPFLKDLESDLASTELPVIIQQAILDIEQVTFAYTAHEGFFEEYIGASLSVNENVLEFTSLVLPFIEQEVQISTADANMIISDLNGFDIPVAEMNSFIDRWNESVTAYQNGVFSPNATYPNIIDRTVTNQFYLELVDVNLYAFDRGYQSIYDMYNGAIATILDQSDNENQGVCASVTIQISQRVTLTREAFEGTLGVLNGHPTDMIDSLIFDLEILNPQGVLSNDLFQIELTNLDQLTGIDGTGTLGAQEQGTATLLFIPERGAAPTVPISYSFGGSIRYKDPFTDQLVTVPLFPVILQVNPSPDLYLHYFMDRDLLGDDALTDVIEPIVPGELAVMIENNGYGPAMGVNIESAQPEIIDNEKGLAISFNLIGTKLQGEEANMGIANINFGDIDPLSTKVGQWFFTSSLLGHFINYETNLVHLSSFGNPDLSLISGVELHELIQTISVYTQDDGIDDFLINGIQDADERPDAIYLSQGNTVYDVYEAENGFFTGDLFAPGNTNTVHVDPSLQGWNYIKLDDPGDGNFEILSVTRSDGQVIPLQNVWLTFVTIPDSKEPIYENKFHIVDEFGTFDEVTYTVVWTPKDPNPPFVESITGQPATVTSDQVELLTVTFSEPIEPSSFGIEDLNLIIQGGDNVIDASVIISQIDSVTYEVDISSVSSENGFYVFTVQADGVEDITGVAGELGEQVSWTQFLTVPSVVQFIGLPVGGIGNQFSAIQLLFNMPINESTLTPDQFSIELNGVAQNGTLSVAPINNEGTLFELSGLETMLTMDGTYELTINLPEIQSQDGIFGLAPQSILLTLDTAPPTLTNLLRFIDGGLDGQHYTGVTLNFSEAINTLESSAISLTKDGLPVDISSVPITSVSDDWYESGSFDLLTYDEGSYEFSVDMSQVSDYANNFGSGIETTSWTVDRSADINITNIAVNPDLGISATDGITSTLNLSVSFDIDQDAETITIYQDDLGTLNLLSTAENVTAGTVTLLTDFPTGGSTAILIEAVDENGNVVTESFDLFLDETSPSVTWDLEPGQLLAEHPGSIQLIFSDPLLNPDDIQEAIFIDYDNNVLDPDLLTIESISDMIFQISGFPSITLLDGRYTVGVDMSLLIKASSGLVGTDISSTNWIIEREVENEITVELGENISICSDEPMGVGNEAILIAEASGGSGNYMYQWSDDLGFGPIKDVFPSMTTKYFVTVTDNLTSFSGTDSITVIVENCSLDLNCVILQVQDVSCFGAGDGMIEIDISTNPSDTEYEIFPVAGSYDGNGTFSNLPPGNYTVFAFDAFEASSSCDEVTITEPEPLICMSEFDCQEELVQTGSWQSQSSTRYTTNVADNLSAEIQVVNQNSSAFILALPTEPITNANASWFSEDIAGATAARFYFVWDLIDEDQDIPLDQSDDKDTSVITINFDQPVLNPVIHIDRLGGATTTGKSNSALWTLISGGNVEKLAGTSNLIVNGDSFHRAIVDSGVLLNPEANSNPNAGTAAGSIRVNTGSPVNSISFELTGIGYEGTGGDAFELIISSSDCIEGSANGENEILVFISETGASDGEIQVTAMGGTAPYSYAISPAVGVNQGNGLFTGLPVGNYTVSITDANLCSEECVSFSVVDPNGNTFTCPAADVAVSDVDVCVDANITLYSNPISDQFQIKGLLENYDIEILNSDGSMHEVLNTNDNYRMVELSSMPSGLYFISIRHKTNQNVQMEKIIKY